MTKPHQRRRAVTAEAYASHVSYWKRAHTDGRFWVGVVLMLAALAVYVFSENLSWVSHRMSATHGDRAGNR